MVHTILFSILDDLEHAYGPKTVQIDSIDAADIFRGVTVLIEEFIANNEDPSTYFMRYLKEDKDLYIVKICNSLRKNNYYVINRFQKYYVIAFSLDYTKFDIFSKDENKILIKWRDDDEDDPITGIITDPDYNENPVITFMRQFNN
jgi:hypothetical protein